MIIDTTQTKYERKLASEKFDFIEAEGKRICVKFKKGRWWFDHIVGMHFDRDNQMPGDIIDLVNRAVVAYRKAVAAYPHNEPTP